MNDGERFPAGMNDLQKRICDMVTAKKIYSTDTYRLNAAIAEAEGRSQERCMTATECAGRLEGAERYMHNPSKAALKGCRCRVHASNESLPRSYKYTASSTQAEFEHDGKGWVLVRVSRDRLKSSAKLCYRNNIEMTMSDSAKEWILAYMAIC